MVTALTTEKFSANNKVLVFDFDPDDADANDVSWQDFKDYETFTAIFFRTVGTGALDTFSILSNPQADGSGTDVTVKAHAVANEPDAVGDYIVLECNTQDILSAAAGVTQRGICVSAEFATATDEGVIIYILGGAKRPQSGLTAESVA